MVLLAGHNPEHLLHLLRALVLIPVLPEPRPRLALKSVAATLGTLLTAHRRYVDEDPERFATLNEIAAVAVVQRGALLEPLLTRNRRTNATVLRHLELLHDQGLVNQPRDRLPAIAAVLVNTANGIELEHLDNPNHTQRACAYDELARSLEAHLRAPTPNRRRSQIRPGRRPGGGRRFGHG